MSEDDERAEFKRAMQKIPGAVRCFANGAVCPWCGALHATVTFGRNDCDGCQRIFCFGYRDWWEDKEPVSFVNFPWKAWDTFHRADLMEDWMPNEQLQRIYFQQAEEDTGRIADMRTPN